MSEYFEYLRLMLEAFFKDFGIFFKDVFASPWDKVGSNVSHYNELFATYSANFGFWGWFFFVLFILIFTAFIGGLCFLIFLGFRKYIRFAKKEISKDKLEETIERLNYELFNAIKEKDKILALKVGELGYKPTEKEKEEDLNKEEIELIKEWRKMSEINKNAIKTTMEAFREQENIKEEKKSAG